MKIICISGKAQHGKDTTANYMAEDLKWQGYRVLITHYGDLLKYICKAFFNWNGEKDDKGRGILQTVGTNIIRKDLPDFWVDFVARMINYSKDLWDYVIIPDCRFPNEVRLEKYFRNYDDVDVIHLRIVRDNFVSPLTEEQQKHESETALDKVLPNYMIHNDGTLEDLQKKAIDMVEIIRER